MYKILIFTYNNKATIFIVTSWIYTACISYDYSIQQGINYDESLKIAILTFPLGIFFFCFFLIYFVFPVFMWSEIFNKIENNYNFDFLDIIFLSQYSINFE